MANILTISRIPLSVLLLCTHPLSCSFYILYGGKDHLTSRETISEFAAKQGADLTVMEDGEHWFHTNAQMQFLDDWIRRSIP